MSIATTTRKAGPFNGNGATTSFPFTFKLFQASDVLVVQTDTTPTDYTLVLNTDYTVTLNANQDSNPGGAVNMVVAPPTGYLLTIGSNVQQIQSVTLTNNGGFYPTVINTALDYLTILVQQVSEKIGRSLTMPFSTSASGQLPPVVPGSLLGWKADGSGIANVGASGVGAGSIVANNMAAGATGTALSNDTQAAALKANPADGDKLPLFDSANFWYLKGLTWANLKATFLAQTDTRYKESGADGTATLIPLPAGGYTFTQADSGKHFGAWQLSASTSMGLPTAAPSVGWEIFIDVGPMNSVVLWVQSGTIPLNLPDGTSIPAGTPYYPPTGLNQAYRVHYDGGKYWLQFTSGRTVVANAVNINEAIALGQVKNAASDPSFADSSALPASTNWVRGAMSAIATAAGFASSFAANGYIKFPSWLGGWIVQWGAVTAAAGGTAVTLPLTFPTAFSVPFAVSEVAGNIAAAVATNTSTITVYNSGGAGTTAWLAIGH